MHTIENLTEAMQPDIEPYPPAKVVSSLGHPPKAESPRRSARVRLFSQINIIIQ